MRERVIDWKRKLTKYVVIEAKDAENGSYNCTW